MDDAEGVAFARLLEELPPAETELSVLFLANHGVLVCAPTVAMAYDSLCKIVILSRFVCCASAG